MVIPREHTCCVFLAILDVVNQRLWVLHSQAQSKGLRAMPLAARVSYMALEL